MPYNIETLLSLLRSMKDAQLSDGIKELLENLPGTGLSEKDVQKLTAQLQGTLDNLSTFQPDLEKLADGAGDYAQYVKYLKLDEKNKRILHHVEEEIGLPALEKEHAELAEKISGLNDKLKWADAAEKQKIKDELKPLNQRDTEVRQQITNKRAATWKERDEQSSSSTWRWQYHSSFKVKVPEHKSVAKDDFEGRLRLAGEALQNGKGYRQTSDAVEASLNTLRDVLQKSELTESGRVSVQKVFQLLDGTQKAFTSCVMSKQLSSLKEKVDAMSRGESDSAEFKNFRTALTEAISGGDMKKLYDKADVYAVEKTKNGNPSSLGGKNRLEAARQVKSLLKDIMDKRELSAVAGPQAEDAKVFIEGENGKQLEQLTKRLESTSKLGSNSELFNNLRDAMKDAMDGGSLENVQKAAKAYEDARSGGNGPRTDSGKERLSVAREVQSLIQNGMDQIRKERERREEAEKRRKIDHAVEQYQQVMQDAGGKPSYAPSPDKGTETSHDSLRNITFGMLGREIQMTPEECLRATDMIMDILHAHLTGDLEKDRAGFARDFQQCFFPGQDGTPGLMPAFTMDENFHPVLKNEIAADGQMHKSDMPQGVQAYNSLLVFLEQYDNVLTQEKETLSAAERQQTWTPQALMERALLRRYEGMNDNLLREDARDTILGQLKDPDCSNGFKEYLNRMTDSDLRNLQQRNGSPEAFEVALEADMFQKEQAIATKISNDLRNSLEYLGGAQPQPQNAKNDAAPKAEEPDLAKPFREKHDDLLNEHANWTALQVVGIPLFGMSEMEQNAYREVFKNALADVFVKDMPEKERNDEAAIQKRNQELKDNGYWKMAVEAFPHVLDHIGRDGVPAQLQRKLLSNLIASIAVENKHIPEERSEAVMKNFSERLYQNENLKKLCESGTLKELFRPDEKHPSASVRWSATRDKLYKLTENLDINISGVNADYKKHLEVVQYHTDLAIKEAVEKAKKPEEAEYQIQKGKVDVLEALPRLLVYNIYADANNLPDGAKKTDMLNRLDTWRMDANASLKELDPQMEEDIRGALFPENFMNVSPTQAKALLDIKGIKEIMNGIDVLKECKGGATLVGSAVKHMINTRGLEGIDLQMVRTLSEYEKLSEASAEHLGKACRAAEKDGKPGVCSLDDVANVVGFNTVIEQLWQDDMSGKEMNQLKKKPQDFMPGRHALDKELCMRLKMSTDSKTVSTEICQSRVLNQRNLSQVTIAKCREILRETFSTERQRHSLQPEAKPQLDKTEKLQTQESVKENRNRMSQSQGFSRMGP